MREFKENKAGPKFAAIPAEVRRRLEGKSGAFHVYGVLAEHYNHDSGKCFPSIDLICEETGKSRSRVYEALKVLESCGVMARRRKGNPRGTGTSYELPFMKSLEFGTEKVPDSGLCPSRIQDCDNPTSRTLTDKGNSEGKQTSEQDEMRGDDLLDSCSRKKRDWRSVRSSADQLFRNGRHPLLPRLTPEARETGLKLAALREDGELTEDDIAQACEAVRHREDGRPGNVMGYIVTVLQDRLGDGDDTKGKRRLNRMLAKIDVPPELLKLQKQLPPDVSSGGDSVAHSPKAPTTTTLREGVVRGVLDLVPRSEGEHARHRR